MLNPTFLPKKYWRSIGLAVGLTILLIIGESYHLQIAYRPFFQEALHRQDYLSILTVILNWGCIALFIWASLTSGPYLRWFYFAIFGFALFFEYGYRGVFTRFSTAQDLIIALTPLDPEISQDAMGSHWDWSPLIVLIPYGCVLIGWQQSSSFLQSLKRLGGVGGMILLLYTLLFFRPNPRFRFPTPAVGAFFRTVTFATWTIATDYHGPRDSIPPITHISPPNNIIFIVDESVRGDHLSLNGYERSTTPYLESLQRQGFLYNWGVTMSGSSCTLISNNLLLSGVLTLPDPEQRLRKNPTLFQYAQANGYTNYHLDASARSLWLGTFDDINYIDEWWNRDIFKTEPRSNIDVKLARKLHNLTSDSRGKFIWVNKRGLHFHYNKHFPTEAILWRPILAPYEFGPQNRSGMRNSYDNALRYNLENFFRTLIGDDPAAFLQDNTILYTSDHGQTLSQQGETWAHCSTIANEMKVPIFMIARQGYTIDTAYKATHFNLFATLLDLIGVPAENRQQKYAPSLLQVTAADSKARFYFVGDIRGRGEFRFLSFD